MKRKTKPRKRKMKPRKRILQPRKRSIQPRKRKRRRMVMRNLLQWSRPVLNLHVRR